MNYKKDIDVIEKATAVLRLKLFFYIVPLLIASAVFLVPIAKIAKADNLGDNRTFFVDPSYDYSGRSEVNATLRKNSSDAYFYVENDYYDNLSDNIKLEFNSYLNSLAEDFDNTIYPKVRETFGHEWNPGIDYDSKITVLLTNTIKNVGGYFNPNDEYKKSKIVDERSNEREMLYINAAFMGDERVKSFLAHEFQHMITWYHKAKLKSISEDVWLNEARSEYASTAIGYDDSYPTSNLKARVMSFMSDPTDSLTEWKNNIHDYSSVNLFSQYLSDHFGKTLFKTMVGNDKVGIESIEKAFMDLNYNANFRDVFTNWTVANYLNDKTLSTGGEYGYLNPNLSYQNFHISRPTRSYIIRENTAVSIITTIKDWSSRYYKFRAGEDLDNEKNNILEVNFDGEDTGYFSVPYVIYYEDGTKRVRELNLDSDQDSKFYVSGFGKNVSSVLMIPSSQKQESGFSSNIGSYSFLLSVKVIEPSILKMYPDGSLLRSVDGPKVYLIENGKKRWITSVAAFNSNGYRWEDVLQITDEELSLYPDGEDISGLNLRPNGSLIKGSGPKVYLIENGKKRWITSAEVFTLKGYDWSKIILVPDSELDLYKDGEDIK
jgi:hypothetical protein